MLISEEARRNIYKIATDLCTDTDFVKKLGFVPDQNKIAYLIETMLRNDTPITSDVLLETAKMLFENVEVDKVQ